jgi:hypothetical protein
MFGGKRTIFIGLIFLLVLSLIPLFVSDPSYAKVPDTILPWPSTFEQRKAQYIQDVMNNIDSMDACQRNNLWGYLEHPAPPTQKQKEIIHIILRAMVWGWQTTYGAETELMQEHNCQELAGYDAGGNWIGYPDKTVGFGKSIFMDHSLALRVLLQYKHLVGTKISQEDYDWLLSEYEKSIDNGSFLIAANGNQQINVMVGLYLYAWHFDRDKTFYFDSDQCRNQPDNCRWPDFSVNGRTYTKGNTYNALQFSEDWLDYILQRLHDPDPYDLAMRIGYFYELDGNYFHAYFNAMLILYDLAADPEYKTKAKMTFDLLLLDAYMDYNGHPDYGEHGGARGRSGWIGVNAYQYILFGFPVEMHPVYPERNVYMTTYRIPDLLRDLVVLTDESEDYWHIHMEFNPNLGGPEHGKYTYVTKYFTLGGAAHGWGNWQFNSSRVKAFINECAEVDQACFMGGEFLQYKNAMLAQGQYTHVEPKVPLEIDERVGGHRFIKSGRLMLALGEYVEGAVEGGDYPDYGSFKEAVLSKEGTSQGDKIRKDSSTGKTLVNGTPIEELIPGLVVPFDRLETIDHQGKKLVDWNNNVMTLSKHGQSCVYNFNTWEFSPACGGSIEVPIDEDVNQDGQVSELDVQIAVDVSLEKVTDPVYITRADVNHDGAIDALDIQQIVNEILK